MTERLLKCTVSEGMFSDECAVQYGGVSVFVPKAAVNNDAVRVQVFDRENAFWAVLPTPDREIIPIKREDLLGK